MSRFIVAGDYRRENFRRIELAPFSGRIFDIIPTEEMPEEDEYQGKELEPARTDDRRNVIVLECDDE